MTQETLDSLAEIYERLQEEDMWAGLWQKRCKFPETSTAIAYEQQGFYEQAQAVYEGVRTANEPWDLGIYVSLKLCLHWTLSSSARWKVTMTSL